LRELIVSSERAICQSVNKGGDMSPTETGNPAKRRKAKRKMKGGKMTKPRGKKKGAKKM
jgi:hypothetical protein